MSDSISTTQDCEAGPQHDKPCTDQFEIASRDENGLTANAREYLLARHGTLSLDPMPDPTDRDPLNWPQWLKVTNIVLVALSAMTSTMNAGSLTPAYSDIADALGVTEDAATYLTTVQSVTLGIAPFFWKPLSDRYGRRPVWIIAIAGSLVTNIGCVYSDSYGAMMVCRFLNAFLISPAASIGTAVMTETFFKEERPKYVGLWTLLVTLGIPIGLVVMGPVTQHLGWRWIYWILTMWNGVQLALAIPFQRESLYMRDERGENTSHEETLWSFLRFRRINPIPITAFEWIQPITLLRYSVILGPAVSYGVLFILANTCLTTEIPGLMEDKFDLDAQALGLQFISVFVGTILGEQMCRYISPWWMRFGARRGGKVRPEWRIWVSYPGFLIVICGFVEFLVTLYNTPDDDWSVVPLIGIAIAAVGLQLVTSVAYSYAVDCMAHEAAGVGVAINLVRQVLIFAAGFFLPYMLDDISLPASAGLGTGLIVVFSIIPMIGLHWYRQQKSQANGP